MKIIITLFLIVLVTIQFSCKSDNQSEEKQVAASTVAGRADNKLFANIQFASDKDASCGMPLSAGVEDTVHQNNKIYGFCSKECKDEFVNKLKTERK